MDILLNHILEQETSRRTILKYGILAGISSLAGIKALNTSDNFLIKDFVIQLKYFGESNYKLYHSQEEKNDNINNRECEYQQTEKKYYNNNEVPLLLGSLMYDESWFKSTIDSEN